MKNKKYSLAWAAFFFGLLLFLFSLIAFFVGGRAISGEIEPLHNFAIHQLEKESRKALTFREGYDGLRDIRIYLEKNNRYTISFLLKDRDGHIVESHIPNTSQAPTYSFEVPIHNLQSNITNLLDGSSEKPTEKLGDLIVMFKYSNPIISYWHLCSVLIGFVISLSIVGIYAMHQAYVYRKETGEQSQKIATISVSLFKSEQSVVRAKSIIDRLYHYFENEFKRPADIIRRHKQSEKGSEELSSKALEKLTYNLGTVLQARDKWLSSGIEGLVESKSDVYVIGNLSCLSSLSLALELEEIRLVSVSSKDDIKDLEDDCICIFDLDPMINNASEIVEHIQLLPETSYKVGIYSGAIDESDIYDMEFDLDWVIKEPLVSQIVGAINNKPRIKDHLPFN